MKHIISLGAGVQSSTMALMAAAGEIAPMPDAAVFADTQAEPMAVYEWLDWLEKQLPFQVYRVTTGNLEADTLGSMSLPRIASPPFYTAPIKTHERGQLRRQCTREYKIEPMNKWLREYVGLARGQRCKKVMATRWIGISLDEAHRMKLAPESWAENRHPLIELQMSRGDCLLWMECNGYPKPGKSACYFCPYHDDAMWRAVEDAAPVNRIITGECRAVMRDLIAQGVRAHCVVTSPPYWGLRSYGTHPVVFGGDESCTHEWGAAVVTDTRAVQIGKASTSDARGHERGNFCRCGAWRGELGREPSVFLYIEHMVDVFRLVRELLVDEGICFVNIGDTYITRPCGGIGHNSTINGKGSHEALREASSQMSRQRNRGILKLKDMALVPQRLAIALQEDGWWVRQDVIWAKANPMPGSYRDRFTTAHEYVWLLAKSERYFFDAEAVKEPASANSHARMARAHNGYHPPGQDKHSGILAPRPNAGVNPKAQNRRPSGWAEEGSHKDLTGRYDLVKQNDSFSAAVVDLVGMRRKRDVWTIPTTPYSGSHYATFPEALVEPCVMAGTSARGHCPKCGAGWTRLMGDPVPAEGRGSGNKERKDRSGYGGVPPAGNEAIGKQNQAFGVPWQPSAPVTIGWAPGCDCQLEPAPAVVFDPFMGTGTVGRVASRLGRNYLGCDLDGKNEALQVERLTGITAGMALA